MTNISDVLAGGSRDTLAKAAAGKAAKLAKGKKRENMYQFVEWNFQKRNAKGARKDREKKDHPSFNIVNKLMDKLHKGQEPKEMMPVKTAVKYIYSIYMGKAQEFAQEKQNQKKVKAEASLKKLATIDPDAVTSKISPRAQNEAAQTTGTKIGPDTNRSSLPRGIQRMKTSLSPTNHEEKPEDPALMNKTSSTAIKNA